VAGLCGHPAYYPFEWHDLAASPVETFGSPHSTTQNAHIVGLIDIHNK